MRTAPPPPRPSAGPTVVSPCPECGGQARIVFSVHKDPTRGSYTPLSGKCASCNVTFGLNQGRVRRL